MQLIKLSMHLDVAKTCLVFLDLIRVGPVYFSFLVDRKVEFELFDAFGIRFSKFFVEDIIRSTMKSLSAFINPFLFFLFWTDYGNINNLQEEFCLRGIDTQLSNWSNLRFFQKKHLRLLFKLFWDNYRFVIIK